MNREFLRATSHNGNSLRLRIGRSLSAFAGIYGRKFGGTRKRSGTGELASRKQASMYTAPLTEVTNGEGSNVKKETLTQTVL